MSIRILRSRRVLLAALVALFMNVQTGTSDTIKQATESVVFIYDSNSRPCDPPPPRTTVWPLGSGFIVGFESAKRAGIWKFLVTARHVIGSRDSVILRLNSRDRARLVCYPHRLSGGTTQIIFAPKRPEVDLVLIHMPDIPDTDPLIFDYSTIADETMYRSWEISEGTEVYTVGYLFGYSGQKQNFPVTRFGKIALLTEEYWYRTQERNLDEHAYLVELQSTPGLSGAPVILRGPQFRIGLTGPQYRKVPLIVVGVIKGLLTSPHGSQGLAATEPARHLKEILEDIVERLRREGHEVKVPR